MTVGRARAGRGTAGHRHAVGRVLCDFERSVEDDALEAAVRVGLLDERGDGRVRFAHDLRREVLTTT